MKQSFQSNLDWTEVIPERYGYAVKNIRAKALADANKKGDS